MILPITDDGIRPAGKPDQCFYCRCPKGEHADDCVCRQRTVVVKLTMDYVISVPAHWTRDDIEFHRNDSSFCYNNDLRDLGNWTDDEGNCSCQAAHVEFVREATEFDMLQLPTAGVPEERKEAADRPTKSK